MTYRKTPIPCKICGELTFRKIYCEPCSIKVNSDGKKNYFKDNPDKFKKARDDFKKRTVHKHRKCRKTPVSCERCGKETFRIKYCNDCYIVVEKEKAKILALKFKSDNPLYYKKQYQDNIERYKELKKKYRKENAEKIKQQAAEYNKKNADKINQKSREYRKNNPEKHAITIKNAKQKRKENGKAREYERNKRKNDIEHCIKMNLRSRIYDACKRSFVRKALKTEQLLGCTTYCFKEYIESLFTEGMSWENYGKGGWEIDHIIPCVSFDLTDPEQQKKCFHYSNLQPLWGKINRIKGDKLNFIYPYGKVIN